MGRSGGRAQLLEDKERRAALRKQMHEIELTQPDPLPTAYAVANMAARRQMHILKIGDPKHKFEPVDPGLPSVLAEENGQRHIRALQPAVGAGKVACFAGKSAHCSSDGESHLADANGYRAGAHAQ